MRIRSSFGLPARYQEIVLRARPTTTFPPPFVIKALGPAIILFVAVIGMSQLSAVVGPPRHEDALTMAMPPRASTSPLFGFPWAPTSEDEPTHVDVPPTVIASATDVGEQVEPVATVVSVASHASPAAAATHPVATVVSAVLRPTPAAAATHPVATVVSAVLRPTPAAAATHPVATVVSAVLRPTPAAAATHPVATVVSAVLRPILAAGVAEPAPQRAHGKFNHTTEQAKATKTTRARTHHDPKRSNASRNA